MGRVIAAPGAALASRAAAILLGAVAVPAGAGDAPAPQELHRLGAAVEGHGPFDRLYWGPPKTDSAAEAPAPPAGGTSLAAKRAKRWTKVFKTHSGKQLIEVMYDRIKKSMWFYLDRALQLTDTGEHMYHEMMAHTPLLTTTQPARDVLVVGAGDGGVSLRVLMHPSVRRVVQVELDEAVVNVSRQYFPELAAAYDDPRMELRIEDAIAWAIREAPKRPDAFDAIVIDSTDEPLISIWTTQFYTALRRMLRPGGVLMQNVQSLDVPEQITNLIALHQSGGFERVRPVLIDTIDYGSPYIAFLSSGLEIACPGPVADAEERARPLQSAWYTPEIHRAALAVPPGMARRWPALAEDAPGCQGDASAASPPSSSDPAAAASSSATAAPTTGSAPPAAAGVDGEARPKDTEESTDDVETVDVAIVGGGLAGITAAHSLTRHLGARSVVILEARDRLGGRIEATDPATFGGVAANIGANWIHFAERNPLLRLAERLGCETKLSSNGNVQWHAHGLGQLSESAVDEARDLARMLGVRLRTQPVPRNVSAAMQLREWAGSSFKAPDPQSHAARHIHFFTDSVQDHTAFLGDVSGSRLCDGVCGGDPQSQDRHLLGEAGAGCLIDGLVSELPELHADVRKGHVVTAIHALGDSEAPDMLELKVAQRLEQGTVSRRLRARTVILAVPLGVLKASIRISSSASSGSSDEAACSAAGAASPSACGEVAESSQGLVEFRPPLPADRTRRWSRLGVGQSLRVALLFSEVFWDSQVEFFAYLFSGEEAETKPGRPPVDGEFFGEAPAVEFLSLANATGHALLLAEVGRHLADNLQRLSDREIGEFLLDRALRKMYADAPPLVAVRAKRFAADPFLRGGLSFPDISEEREEAAEGSGGDREEEHYELRRSKRALRLWAPLWQNRLVFAGEHTSLRIGTLDGALISGLQGAWVAACTLSGGAPPPVNPIELLRALGIFGDWFPQRLETRRCLERFATAGYSVAGAPGGRQPQTAPRGRLGGSRGGGGGGAPGHGPCSAPPRWLEDLEIACRYDPPGEHDEVPPWERGNDTKWRHCLEQGH